MKKGLYLYGVHSVEEALELAPERVREAWGVDWGSRSLGPIAARLDALGVTRGRATPGELDRMSQGTRHQGVVAYVGDWEYEELGAVLDRCEEKRQARLLFLDQVQDAGNMGAILRSAAAFGVEAVVVPARRSAPMSGAVIRASAGQAWRVPVVQVTNLGRALEEAKGRGFWGVTTDVGEGSVPWELDWSGMKLALVLGGEHRGVRSGVASKCEMKVCVPMAPGVESLNVASATSVVLYEAYRQHARGEGA